MSQEGVRSQLQRTDDAIKGAIGERPTLFRPPMDRLPNAKNDGSTTNSDTPSFFGTLIRSTGNTWPSSRSQSNSQGNSTRFNRAIPRHSSGNSRGDAFYASMSWRPRVSSLSPFRSSLGWQHRRRRIRKRSPLRKPPQKPLHLPFQHLLQAARSSQML